MTKTGWALGVLSLLGTAAEANRGELSPAGTLSSVEVRPDPAQRRVEVRVDGQAFTSYLWTDRLAKPVLFPILSAGGNAITRGFPLQPRAGERVDHPHQVGLWFNHGDVNGVDFWNNSEARPEAERARLGRVRHVAIHEARGGAGEGRLRVGLEWWLPAGRLALREEAAFTFRVASGRRAIDRATTLTAVEDRVTFTDNKEGLIALRVARSLEEPSPTAAVLCDAEGRPATAAAVSTSGVSGRYTSSEGLTGDAVWGTRARWLALSGRVGDEAVVLLLLDHPANPGHPTHWHARGYGLFAANPLAAAVFSGGRERLDLTLAKGESVRFRHRLLILTGSFSAAAAEAAWRDFAAEGRE